MKEKSFLAKLNEAIEGLISLFRGQRTMKVHLLLGILLFGLGVFLGLNKVELIFLGLVLGLILFAEMVNTCMETILDFLHPDYHEEVKRIKGLLAGSVLFMGLLSFVIAYLLLAPKLEAPIQNGFERLRGADWYITFFTLLFVIAVVIIIKTIFHRGKPLRGGLPSGHAALAFSVWMMITLLKSDPLLSILVFLLALMISASRLKEGIHNLLEVLFGAVLGVLITILLLQLLGG